MAIAMATNNAMVVPTGRWRGCQPGRIAFYA
jgi:hypothetical protein